MSRLGIIFILLSFSLSASADWKPYVVQSGDTLGSIGRRYLPDQKVWGENGSAQQIFQKNVDVIRRMNLILAGQKILVPEKPDQKQETLASTKPEIENNIQIQPEPPQTFKTTDLEKHTPAKLRLGLAAALWDRALTDRTSNARGTARSNAILGLSVEFLLPVSAEWNLNAGLLFRQIGFGDAADRKIVEDGQNFLRLMVGASKTSGEWEFGAGLQYEQLPLVTGVSLASVGLTTFHILSPTAKLIWNFHRFELTTVGLGASAEYHLPVAGDPYRLENGWNATLSLPVRRRLSDSRAFILVPFAELGVRETNTVRHSDLMGGLQLLYEFAD